MLQLRSLLEIVLCVSRIRVVLSALLGYCSLWKILHVVLITFPWILLQIYLFQVVVLMGL